MRLDQFTRHAASGVLLAPDGSAPAGYLDGAERRLLELLGAASDRSVLSEELRRHRDDWATEYHLTPYRSTLFDCIGLTRGNARVLELGCGCGAVTRWLGEHCAEVHAVEGSPDRAQVARARCAELDNVEVYAANYSQLEEEDRFDVATLIGVLEYGHLYHPETSVPAKAALANLRVVRRALRADGVLVLAIENKLGLKYLSGAREDHSGRPFDSIEGYPLATSAVTFSARELELLLAEAGFAHSDWLVPYPDYKLVRTVVNAERATDADHVHNWLEGPAPDRGAPQRALLTFNETLAQREVVKAGLLRDLANSFLVVAYAGDPAAARERLGIELDWTVRHYSLDRRADCRKRVTLRGADAPVEHAPPFGAVGRGAGEWADLGGFSHRFPSEPFEPGELLSNALLATIAREGIDARFAEQVRELGRWLARTHGTGGVDDSGAALLDGAALDALWWNVVVGPDGGWAEIDREWRCERPLPLDYVLWRGLLHLSVRFRAYLPAAWAKRPPAAFAADALALACGPRAKERLACFAAVEQAFAAAAGGGERRTEALAALPAPDGPRVVAVLADADEVVGAPGLLAAFCERFDAADPITLLLRGSAATDVQRLQRLCDELAAGRDLPDLLFGTDPAGGEDVAVTAGAIARLSERDEAGAEGALPCFGAGEGERLRAFAAERWTAAPAAGAVG